MPNVTQYIRKGDIEKWNAIPNKSEFIHNALNSYTGDTPAIGGKLAVSKDPITTEDILPEIKTIKTPREARKAVEPITPHKNFLDKKASRL